MYKSDTFQSQGLKPRQLPALNFCAFNLCHRKGISKVPHGGIHSRIQEISVHLPSPWVSPRVAQGPVLGSAFFPETPESVLLPQTTFGSGTPHAHTAFTNEVTILLHEAVCWVGSILCLCLSWNLFSKSPVSNPRAPLRARSLYQPKKGAAGERQEEQNQPSTM